MDKRGHMVWHKHNQNFTFHICVNQNVPRVNFMHDLLINWQTMITQTVHATVSWRSHKQWLMIHTSELIMMIRQSTADISIVHHIDVIMTTMASQITSLTVIYPNVYSDAHQRKHQSSASLAFVWGIHRDRWIPRTKGQLRGKCFHLMTSSCIIRTTLEVRHIR